MSALFKYAKKPLLVLLALISLSLVSNPSYSFEPVKGLQVHGFASQGYFLTDENNVFGKSSKTHGTLGLSRLGLNASFRPFDNIRLAIQGIYDHSGNISEGAEIDFALLDWNFLNTNSTQMGIRIGRIKNPLGFYNEVRDIPFTRPSISLPNLYYERSHRLFLSADGAQLYANSVTDIGNFSFQLNVGKLGDQLDELEAAIFLMDVPGELNNKTSNISKVAYESISGATQLAFSYANINMEYNPSSADVLRDGDLNFKQYILSAQHRIGNFTLTGEYMRQANTIGNFGPFFQKITLTSESYYLQADYHFNSHFKGYTRYDVLFLDKDNRNGKSVPAGSPRSTAFNKEYLFGLQWTPSKEWMLRAEYHRINGTAQLSFADNPNHFAKKAHWNKLALQLSYRF